MPEIAAARRTLREDGSQASAPAIADTKPHPGGQYRGDIDGLRAVSILAVIAFHAGLSGFEGGYVGVDVFFVISGFLITGLLVREVSDTGTVSLGKFYSRRIRRLLPLAATVLTTTIVLGSVLLPPLARPGLMLDAVAASIYGSNWRSAGAATAYSDTLVEDNLLVHFWSLSIEEQFYLLWPFLILVVAFVCRKFPKVRLRTLLGVVLFGLTAWSFVLSLTLTASRGPEAYYLTQARLWEMGVGGGLALAAPILPVIGRRLSGVLAGGGLAAIGFGIVAFDDDTAFPGSAALFPVLGCTAVIVAGLHSTGPISRWLGTAPMRFIGRLSYAWYLWHWPAIGLAILWTQRTGLDQVPEPLVIAVAIAASFLLAWITHLVIENPLRQLAVLRGDVVRNLTFGLMLTAVPLVLGFVLIGTVESGNTPVATPSGVVGPDSMTSLAASRDRSPLAASCDEDSDGPTSPQFCEVGNPEGNYKVLLVGDSHAQQWNAAFASLAESEDWSVRVSTRNACEIIDVAIWSEILRQPDTNCGKWRALVKDEIRTMGSVDLIVMSRAAFYRDRVLDEQGDFLVGPALHAEWANGAERTFDDYVDLGDRVVFLAGIPWPGFNPPTCLSATPMAPDNCAFELSGSIHDQEFLDVVSPIAMEARVDIVDTASMVCTTPTCSVVAPNGRIIYRDSNHLTATFARDLAPQLLAALDVENSGRN